MCRHLIGIRGTSWGKAIIAAIAFQKKKKEISGFFLVLERDCFIS